MKISLYASLISLISVCYSQNTCNAGTSYCCNSVQSTNDPVVSQLAGLLGVVLNGAQGQIGLTCTPISVIGVGGNSCSAIPVCCTGNSFSGLLVLGCTPPE